MANLSDDDRRRQAERDIARVNRDSAPILDSAFARAADGSAPRPEEDPAEIWGKRVGRGLALVVGAGCLVYLYLTYIA